MNSLPPSTSRRAAASAIRPQSSAIGGPAAYFSTLATRPSTGSLIPAFSSSAINHQPSVLGRFAAFTLIELLVVIAIIAILAALAFPAVNGAINSARKAQARNDVQQIVAAVKAFKAEYGRMPSGRVGNSSNIRDDSEGGGQNASTQREIIDHLLGVTRTLNTKGIVFLEPKTTTGTKGGYNTSTGVFYDPWGTAYFIKIDTNYDDKIEYHNNGIPNIFGVAMAESFGPDKEMGNPVTKDAKGKDNISSYQ